MKTINFAEITLREQVTSRGGGIEIDLSSLGFPNEKMSAYQNYLGGGMLGRVCVNNTIQDTDNVQKELMYSSNADELDQIGDQLKRYYFCLTNPSDSEWEYQSYEQNQKMSARAY